MASPVSVPDEPLTPTGRLFLQPQTNTVIHCAVGVKNQMDIELIKTTVKNSLLLKQPRFSSLLVHDKNGREYWRRTEIDIDQHIIVVDTGAAAANGDDDVEKIVNDYIADLSVSTPLSTDKPLWEIHLMIENKCLVFRIHHGLGDGISLMSMLLACCRKVEDPSAVPRLLTGGNRSGTGKGKDRRGGSLMGVLKMVYFNIVFCIEFVLRSLFVRDRKTAISGGDGMELWPRKVATAKFLIEDMKTVKSAVAKATINDVIFGVISAGLSRYLDHRSPNSLRDGQQLTGVAMVNLRQQPQLQDLTEKTENNSGSRWGNRFGIFLLPAYYHKDLEPLQYVKRAQPMTNRKKKSAEAHFSYMIGSFVMHRIGPKIASLLNYRILCNTTFTISNVVGPQEEITMAGNPVTFLRVSTSSLPQAVAMHIVSYAGRADMQIAVAKDLIPDPEFLAKCFEDCLLDMKKAAAAST